MSKTISKTIKEDSAMADISEHEQNTLQFVSLFAHDLESPLVAIKSILRLLSRERFDKNKQTHQTLLSSSIIAIDRAEMLIYDMISSARAKHSTLVVNSEICNLKEIISNSCQLSLPAANERKIQIVNQSSDKTISVVGDKHLILRVLDNLIFNAIRYSPPDSQVSVSVKKHSKMAEVYITDTGPGFKDINPDELFSVFKQADHRNQGLHCGVGIGLYFCRQAIEAMGGTIKAQNSKKDGAVFRFTLPVA